MAKRVKLTDLNTPSCPNITGIGCVLAAWAMTGWDTGRQGQAKGKEFRHVGQKSPLTGPNKAINEGIMEGIQAISAKNALFG